MGLDERKFLILQAIIDDYITTAMPVGSRTISRKAGVGFSPATIRNEMSDLEELGYLDQPHTSAGRVPSYKAYRLYVISCSRPASFPRRSGRRSPSTWKRAPGRWKPSSARAARVPDDDKYTPPSSWPHIGSLRGSAMYQIVPICSSTEMLIIVTSAESRMRLSTSRGIERRFISMASPCMLTEQLSASRLSLCRQIFAEIIGMGNESASCLQKP